ncbi:Serine/threonine protein phosphatase [Rhodovastum atsumiense]|uniref:Serine/threonine protein phosphatase n=1 Tax=Rhodovastum atsumiense TaxID=504468 RepID=A0A5M6ITD1_9PROT|nr:metallophosphoesterase family protein [Rhodovastum atsumiense]KAA5611522.1 serine/threonine protein phosphatase [Rhodovastum atsumiense]CAH2601222.1 Serine/threonine protein phosphatase [Rhodovastum atsumiense]
MITFALAPATLPAGERVYAVGDVHGCSDRLRALHREINRDLVARPVADALVIHLGDYVDRGPDSAGVVETLLQPFPFTGEGPGPRVINLMGNHEEMMLMSLADADTAPVWLANGGDMALESWGVSLRTRVRQWVAAIPDRHLSFLQALPLMHAAGGYVFVHAGLRPRVPLTRQSRFDMLWIREPFLSFEGDLPGVVVHGHTPEPEPVVRPHRIGIDTGACMGGALTCLVLEADRMSFLRA